MKKEEEKLIEESRRGKIQELLKEKGMKFSNSWSGNDDFLKNYALKKEIEEELEKKKFITEEVKHLRINNREENQMKRFEVQSEIKERKKIEEVFVHNFSNNNENLVSSSTSARHFYYKYILFFIIC
jgi:hypothetical protein